MTAFYKKLNILRQEREILALWLVRWPIGTIVMVKENQMTVLSRPSPNYLQRERRKQAKVKLSALNCNIRVLIIFGTVH